MICYRKLPQSRPVVTKWRHYKVFALQTISVTNATASLHHKNTTFIFVSYYYIESLDNTKASSLFVDLENIHFFVLMSGIAIILCNNLHVMMSENNYFYRSVVEKEHVNFRSVMIIIFYWSHASKRVSIRSQTFACSNNDLREYVVNNCCARAISYIFQLYAQSYLHNMLWQTGVKMRCLHKV